MAVFAPMPRARTMMAATEKPGLLARTRRAYVRSCSRLVMGVLAYGRDGIRGRMFPADRVNWGAVGAVRARVLRAPGIWSRDWGVSPLGSKSLVGRDVGGGEVAYRDLREFVKRLEK